jgi:excisionase family DNA binding protein
MHPRANLAHSKRDAASLLGISERLLDQLLSVQKIESFRVGRRVLVPHSALLAFLREETDKNSRRTAR